jgi:hypothetical protein
LGEGGALFIRARLDFNHQNDMIKGPLRLLMLSAMYIAPLFYLTLELVVRLHDPLAPSRMPSHGDTSMAVHGRWQDTLYTLGIDPFSLTPDPKSLRQGDLKKKKRSLHPTSPRKPTSQTHAQGPLKLFISGDPAAGIANQSPRKMLEKEIQAFKKLYEEHRAAERRSARKQTHSNSSSRS